MRRFQPDPSSYEIVKNGAEGLSATVCKAIRLNERGDIRQQVALKIPKDRTRIADLRHEFESLSRVNSRNCARALAWENDGDTPILVLEWVEGPTLFELATTLDIPTELQSEILSQVALGLLDLKRVGLCHGDLHPANVMIGSDGIVRLIDFANRNETAVSENLYGVPAFMAPELISRKAAPSFSTDLYALGMMARGLRDGFATLSTVTSAIEVGLTAQDPNERELEWQNICSADSICFEQGEPFIQISRSLERETAIKQLIEEFLSLKQMSQTRLLPSEGLNSAERVLRQDLVESSHLSIASDPEQSLKRARPERIAARIAAMFLALAFFSATSVSVQAEAPLIPPVFDAKLTVTTSQWAEVSLNGKKVGYSPIRIGKLTPGRHRLSWSSAFGAGSLVLELRSGEFKLIDERALRAHSEP